MCDIGYKTQSVFTFLLLDFPVPIIMFFPTISCSDICMHVVQLIYWFECLRLAFFPNADSDLAKPDLKPKLMTRKTYISFLSITKALGITDILCICCLVFCYQCKYQCNIYLELLMKIFTSTVNVELLQNVICLCYRAV